MVVTGMVMLMMGRGALGQRGDHPCPIRIVHGDEIARVGAKVNSVVGREPLPAGSTAPRQAARVADGRRGGRQANSR